MCVKDEPPEKQLSDISVITVGIFIEASIEQFKKALTLILFNLYGKFISER